jgi:maleate isomerase
VEESCARVGLIIPSSNTFSEPQFNRLAPPGLDVHVTRARIAGRWKRPLSEMADEIATAARLLSDCAPNVIVFHCTETSMTQGPQGEGKILEIIEDATGVEAMATSKLVQEALQTLSMKKIVLLTPYNSNENIIRYLRAAGIDVVSDVAMAIQPEHFGRVASRQWTELASKHDGPDADGIFLSCTNTTQIEAIADIERLLGKPAVSSNQAVLWGCVRKLRKIFPASQPMPQLGRLLLHWG